MIEKGVRNQTQEVLHPRLWCNLHVSKIIPLLDISSFTLLSVLSDLFGSLTLRLDWGSLPFFVSFQHTTIGRSNETLNSFKSYREFLRSTISESGKNSGLCANGIKGINPRYHKVVYESIIYKLTWTTPITVSDEKSKV